ncbi:MAG: PAS domain S-box protein, partial [Bacteroidota bacterium]
YTLSDDKAILDMNHCGAGMLGIGNQRSRLTNTHFDSYVSPNTRPVFNAFIDKIFKSKQVEKCDVMLETEDNQPIFIHIEGVLTGNGLYCLLNVVDITERKLTEDTLMQTSARLALATRAGGVGVWDMDIASNRLIWDDHMFSLYGLDKKDFKHAYNSWLAGVHPDDKERSDRDIQMAIHGEKEFDTEFRVCWPDGSIHNIRAIAEVQHDSSGKVRSLIGTNWDITDQKKLEEKLKSSETNFRAFFETMNDMIIVGNTEGKIIYVNNALRNILGYQDEDLKDMYVLDLNPAELRADAEEIMGEMIAGKRNTCPLPLARKDGTLVPAETHVWFGKWDGKDCIFGLAKDLSAVQEALQKFNRIFNSNPALMAISTIPEGLFTDVNNTFLAKTEYSRQEIIGKTTAELGLFLQPEKQQEAAMELASTGILHNFELQIKTKTGKILDGLFSGEIIESQGKKYFLTVMIDISERKKAEDELRRSESNLAEAQRIAHLGSWEWKMATNTVKWSKEMFRIFDVNPDTFDGNPDSLVRVLHPDDVERFTRNLISNVVSAEASSLEYRAIRVDGSIRYILADGRMSFDKTGQPFRSVGTVQDITDRKRAEEDLYQSKSFLNSVVENIPHMIFIKDAKELRFIRLNKAAENLLGIPIDEMVGKNDYDFFSKELADNYNEKDRKVLGNKNMADIPEEPIQTRYKGTRILHTKKVPILNNQGEPEYLLGISEDITEFKQSELTRKIQEEKYRTILSSSPDGVFLIDLDGIISEVSDIGLGIFGARSREDLVGKSIFHFAPSEARNTVREIIEKTMNEGLAQNIELRIRKLNKSILLSEISSTLIQDMDGKPISFMIIIRDISHRKVMETKQIHADRMANLGEMASGIAHEINQPLNIISMVMDKILFESSKTETIKLEFLKNKSDKIFDNIIRIRNIIDHVRTFSRSHDDYVLTAFDINTSIENATSMILEQFKHMGIKLLLQLDKNIPPLFGNTFKFEQVIVNLLVNAKDAVMEKKSKQEDDFEMSVTISSFQEGQFLVAEIADNGIGIPHDDINNIMLPFYTTKEEGKGTGLGLSICYQIVKEMGGTIEIASDRVHGTKIKLLMDLQNIKKK